MFEATVFGVVEMDFEGDVNLCEGRPPDPTSLSQTLEQNDGIDSLPSLSFVPETCPLPLTISQSKPTVDMTLSHKSSGSNSQISDLLEAPVDEISRSMVAPLLGTIYNSSDNTAGTGVPKNLTLASTQNGNLYSPMQELIWLSPN